MNEPGQVNALKRRLVSRRMVVSDSNSFAVGKSALIDQTRTYRSSSGETLGSIGITPRVLAPQVETGAATENISALGSLNTTSLFSLESMSTREATDAFFKAQVLCPHFLM